MSAIDHLLYAAAWGSFGVGHSLLAGASARHGLGRWFGRYHRIAYNLIATLHIAAVLWLGARLASGAPAWPLPTWLAIALDTIVAAGVVLGVLALKSYAPAPFIGWAQLRGQGDDAMPLVIDGLHRRFRHPLYSAALLIVWGLVRSDLALATALWASLYLLIGSIAEERRLIGRYGDDYRRYQASTSRFLPSCGAR
jgi:protein-S-isoprenylcysteine O-methyltransferase Ste14